MRERGVTKRCEARRRARTRPSVCLVLHCLPTSRHPLTLLLSCIVVVVVDYVIAFVVVVVVVVVVMVVVVVVDVVSSNPKDLRILKS